MTLFDIKDIAEQPMHSTRTGEKFSLAKSLSGAAALADLLVHHETLLPGTKASSPHYHTKKEELIFVLDGVASIWINHVFTSIHPGMVAAFPAGEQFAHAVFNNSDQPIVFLSIGNNPIDDETIYIEMQTIASRPTSGNLHP